MQEDELVLLHLTVKSDVMPPPPNCDIAVNIAMLIAPNKLHRKLQVASISILNQFVDFADRNATKQLNML